MKNLPFPVISHLSDLEDKVSHKEEIRIKTEPNGFTVASYVMSDNKTFNDEYSRECRGITFDKNGDIASRSLHKFFNVNERDETNEENLKWNDIHCILDKLDGSMLSPVMVNGECTFKTKKSFTSDVANSCNEFVKTDTKYIAFSSFMLSELNATPIFEYMSPDTRIVILCKHPAMKLLHIRNNISGEYYTRDQVQSLAKDFGIPVVNEVSHCFNSFSDIIDECKTLEGVEGFIVQFNNGEMVKIKTLWYLRLHRAVSFLRERDIALLVIEEEIDDIKSHLVETGVNLDKVNEIESRVLKQINDIHREIIKICIENGELSRKDFAAKFAKHELFWLLMQAYLGQEANVKKFFLRNILKTYTLDSI